MKVICFTHVEFIAFMSSTYLLRTIRLTNTDSRDCRLDIWIILMTQFIFTHSVSAPTRHSACSATGICSGGIAKSLKTIDSAFSVSADTKLR